jgi:ammonia channel protein AmtB
MSPDAVQMLFAVAIGFAVAGVCVSAYRLATDRLPSIDLLNVGPRPAAFGALALLIFAAPFLIVRSTFASGGPRLARFQFAFLAAMIAGIWSMMSGLALVDLVQALLAG